MDVGAEYYNYASDMTVVYLLAAALARQKAVYNSVYFNARRNETSKARVSLHEYHKEVGELMTKQL